MKKLAASLALVASLAATTASAGCAAVRHEATIVERDLIDCAKQDLGKTVASAGLSVLAMVVTVFYEGGGDMSAKLSALESAYGPKMVGCAAKIAGDLFAIPASANPSGAEHVETPADRANAYIAAKGLKFAK